MRPKATIHEVFAMRFNDILGRYNEGSLNTDTAAELLCLSVSIFYHKSKSFEVEGEPGFVDKRIGKLSGRCTPVDEAMRIISLYKIQYADFTVKHFHEHLCEKDISHSYTWVKNILRQAGVVKKSKKTWSAQAQKSTKAFSGTNVAPGRLHS